DGIGHYDSLPIEAVTLVLMLAGNVNFLTAYLVLRRRYSAFYRSGELRLLAVTLVVSITLVCDMTTWSQYSTAGKSFRVAVFETVSAVTTTGFSTVSHGDWNSVGIVILIGLMIVGGGTCSTAAGLKQYRVYLFLKALGWEIRRALLPRSAVV